MTNSTFKNADNEQGELDNLDPSEGRQLMRAFLAISSRYNRLKVITVAQMLAAASSPGSRALD